jgi:hypothetical protein
LLYRKSTLMVWQPSAHMMLQTRIAHLQPNRHCYLGDMTPTCPFCGDLQTDVKHVLDYQQWLFNSDNPTSISTLRRTCRYSILI